MAARLLWKSQSALIRISNNLMTEVAYSPSLEVPTSAFVGLSPAESSSSTTLMTRALRFAPNELIVQGTACFEILLHYMLELNGLPTARYAIKAILSPRDPYLMGKAAPKQLCRLPRYETALRNLVHLSRTNNR